MLVASRPRFPPDGRSLPPAGEAEWPVSGPPSSVIPPARRVAEATAAVVFVFAALALVGWQFGLLSLKTLFHPGGVAMNPATAVALLLASASLWLLAPAVPSRRRRGLATAAASALTLVAALKLAGFAIAGAVGVDRLLYAARLGDNRMAPNTALCLFLCGMALATLDVRPFRGVRPSQPFAVGAAGLALLSLVGFLYGVTSLYRVASFIPMAVNTALAVGLLCVGIFAARPDREPVATLASRTAGGMMARRLLPAAVLVPLVLGWLRLTGQQAGWFGLEFGISAYALATVVLLVLLIWWNARDLVGLDRARRDAHQQLEAQNVRLAEAAAAEHDAREGLQRAAAALEHERFLLHTLLENLPDHIYFKDAESRFLRVGRALAEAFGLGDPAAAVGKTDADYFGADHSRAARRDEEEVMRLGRPLLGVEERETWPDGRESWVITSKLPLRDPAGRTLGTFGISRDISGQKRVQEELRRAKEAAEEADKAKSAFLANMSHEIRTPMNAVLGLTELVLDTDLSDTQQEYLRMVHTSGEALLALLDDILDFSKIEAGKIELERVPFSLREVLGDAVKTLGLRADRKGLELALHVAQDVPEAVVGDPGRLRQVIVNLVGNAIKFTERGEVVVDVSSKARDASQPSSGGCDEAGAAGRPAVALRFAVRDTGVGIPPDKQGLIFEAFEQADTSTTRRYGGTGLGLAISARLVSLMGGRIDVESEVGRGSVFGFDASFGAAAVPPAWLPPSTLAGLRVLVVDDNATNRLILEETLRGWGMRPATAAGTEEALAMLARAATDGAPYRLILTDANMPGRDGFGLADDVRGDVRLDSPVVMMLTSGARPGDFARCEESDITGFLIKPVKQADLLRAVTAALGRPAPVAKPAAAAAPQDGPAAATAPAGGLRLLLAEDSVINQRLAVGLLRQWGHDVTVANNGREALERLAEAVFDVVLMDVQMPEMDGFEATAAIRERERATGGTRR